MKSAASATAVVAWIERELGWRAEENFESGIAKTVCWYIDQKPWWTAILARGYAAKRVGFST
jgi:dTDP-glucose 4,6-dehydratase